MGTTTQGLAGMATQGYVIPRMATAKGAGQTMRRYREHPERFYWTLHYMLVPDALKYRRAKNTYYELSRELIQSNIISNRVELARYIIDNRRIDMVFDMFSVDDYYLEDSLKLLAKLGMQVEVEELEVVD